MVCKRELVGIPRVKDPRGNYFCEACYEEARRKREAQFAETMVDEPAIGGGDSPDATPSEEHLLDLADTAASGLTADVAAFDAKSSAYSDSFDPASSQHAARRCPQCRSIIAADARFCSNCGSNVEVEMEFEAPAAPTPVRVQFGKYHSLIGAETGRNWPTVVGTIWVFVAGFEAVVNTVILIVGVVRLFDAGDIGEAIGQWRVSGSLAGSIVLLGLCWWLWSCGRSLQYRSPNVRTGLMQWGVLKALVTLGAFVGAVFASEHRLADNLVMMFAIYLVWLLLWPTFVLFWVTRPDIRREMMGWGARPGAMAMRSDETAG
jgi:hypothetical protein